MKIPTQKRGGRFVALVLGLAIVIGGFAVEPAQAGSATGCRRVTRSVDDHTLLGARAYRFTSNWAWCWHGSVVTKFTRSFTVDHLDYLYHWDRGNTETTFSWLRAANVPYRPSNRGGWRSHVKVNIHNCLWLVCGDINPYMNARGYAGGRISISTGGFSWTQ